MQRGNFVIGDEKNRSAIYQTTYGTGIATENKQMADTRN